jgi:hypothetical protein
MSRNPCLDAAIDELNLAGVRDVTHAPGSKHWQLRWQSLTGTPRMLSISITPSDRFAPAKVRADVRRLLRADGMLVDRAPAKPRPLDRMSRLEQRVAAVELELAAMRDDRGNRNRRDEKGVNTHG